MTFKIKISQFMTKVNPNHENETKFRHFYLGHVQIWHYFSLFVKHQTISITFIIGTFQSHCKIEHNQESEIKPHMTCANVAVFFYLQNNTLLNLSQKNPQAGSKINTIFWLS